MLTLLLAIAMGFFTLTRLVLALMAGPAALPFSFWPSAFLKGIVFDIATLAYLFSALLLLRAVLPNRVMSSQRYPAFQRAAVVSAVAFFLLLSVMEITFWLEFSTRFNFIALDYLIYTQAVLRNLWQSYPIIWILSGITVLAGGLGYFLYRRYLQGHPPRPLSLRQRGVYLALSAMICIISSVGLSADSLSTPGNIYAEELSRNGLFTFAAAARNNGLDYDRFYLTIPQEKADAILKSLQVERTEAYRQGVDRWGDDHPGEPPAFVSRAPRNIVLISVESLSARFLGVYGSQEGLTPQIDRLAAGGLLFSSVFATGTRTVRGLEALSLGTPPIPGQAIIRRPRNAGLATLGEILTKQNFDAYFVYGGYGYFDNMNAYFKANAYRVVDRTDFPSSSIVFENVWGVADEVLYANTVSALDQSHARGRRFFAHVMTTSNHRPYTYPDGRIDIRSPGGRRGAVKYTDYALGQFIEACRKKPWFKETVFVITADHCSSAAGKTDLPVAQYKIPLILYAPALLKPGRFDRMVSQIDIAPTLLDVLVVAGDDNFFGKEMNEQSGPARAFISNYQDLGYYKENQLIVLKPKHRVDSYAIDPKTLEATPNKPDPRLVEEAIAYYQTASRAYRDNALQLLWK